MKKIYIEKVEAKENMSEELENSSMWKGESGARTSQYWRKSLYGARNVYHWFIYYVRQKRAKVSSEKKRSTWKSIHRKNQHKHFHVTMDNGEQQREGEREQKVLTQGSQCLCIYISIHWVYLLHADALHTCADRTDTHISRSTLSTTTW